MSAPAATRPRTSGARLWVFRLLTLLLVLGSAVVGLELGLRILGLDYGHSPDVGHPVFHHWNPSDYEQLVYGTFDQFGGFRMYFNSEGMAMRSELPTKDTPSLVFLGDSFTLARQVPEEQRFASLVGARLGMPIVNLGNGSACPLLEALALEYFSGKLNPRAVVLQLYSNDIDGETRMRKLAVRDATGRIVAVPGSATPLSIRLGRRSNLVRFIRSVWLSRTLEAEHRQRNQTDEAIDPWSWLHMRPLGEMYSADELEGMRESILRIDAFCRQRGCQLFLMVIPDRGALKQGQVDYFTQYFREFAAEAGIPFIDVEPCCRREKAEDLYFPLDIHLTKRGHEVFAEAVVEALTAAGVAGLRSAQPSGQPAGGPPEPGKSDHGAPVDNQPPRDASAPTEQVDGAAGAPAQAAQDSAD